MTTKKTKSKSKKYQDILTMLNWLVISSFKPMFDNFPELKEVLDGSKAKKPIKEWDFFMRVAGISYLTLKLKGEGWTELVENDEQTLFAFQDLINFAKKYENIKDISGLNCVVGLWVLWNIKKEKPTDKETKRLAPAIGAYLDKITDDLTK